MIVKTTQAILVTHYPGAIQPGAATNTVEQLADYPHQRWILTWSTFSAFAGIKATLDLIFLSRFPMGARHYR